MKINKAIFWFLFTLILLVGRFESNAQEAGSPSFEAYDKDSKNEREKAVAHPELDDEQKSTKHTVKDSLATPIRNVYKPSPVVPKSTDGASNDDSILSFNFLYYLIQKYKMQDILE